MTHSVPEALHQTYLGRISDARIAVNHAEQDGDATIVTAAQQRLRAAVDIASDAGVSWMEIGDLLGLARGNAYQKYRRRPTLANRLDVEQPG